MKKLLDKDLINNEDFMRWISKKCYMNVTGLLSTERGKQVKKTLLLCLDWIF